MKVLSAAMMVIAALLFVFPAIADAPLGVTPEPVVAVPGHGRAAVVPAASRSVIRGAHSRAVDEKVALGLLFMLAAEGRSRR